MRESQLNSLNNLILRIQNNDPELSGDDFKKEYIDDSSAEKIVAALADDSTLTDINLESSKLTIAGLETLSNAKKSLNLRNICLEKQNIGKEETTRLVNLIKNNDNIVDLYLADNHINDEAAAILADGIKESQNLKRLIVTNNQISAKGASFIADALVTNTSLESLDLKQNRIGNEGAQHIARILTENITLREINIASNGITDEGILSICQALTQNSSLKYCNLSKNAITAEGFEGVTQVVGQNHTLEFLRFDRNIKTPKAGNQFMENLYANPTLTRITTPACYRYGNVAPILKQNQEYKDKNPDTNTKQINEGNQSQREQLQYIKDRIKKLPPQSNFTTDHLKEYNKTESKENDESQVCVIC